MPAKLIDITGQKRGHKTIIGIHDRSHGYIRWKYVCDCGNEGFCSVGSFLKSKDPKCPKCSRSTKRVEHDYKHPLYKIRYDIIDRCENKNHHAYKDYGGRGITVCEEWINSYQSFYDWCIENGWREGLFVDKDKKAQEKGVDGLIYSPEMCSIVTRVENNQLRRGVKLDMVKANEIRSSGLSVRELCKIYGVDRTAIYYVKKNKIWKQ